MGSPPTSDAAAPRQRFLDLSGLAIGGPSEWMPALIEVLVPTGVWEDVDPRRQGQDLPVFLHRFGDQVRVIAEWPRSGTGHYRLRVEWRGLVEEQILIIMPQKISLDAYRCLLDESRDAAPRCSGPWPPAVGGTHWCQAATTGGDDTGGRAGAASSRGGGHSRSARAHPGIAGVGA